MTTAKHLTDKINQLFSRLINPPVLSILSAKENFSQFQCLYTNTTKYRENEPVSIYKLDSLLRLLLENNNILSNIALDELYEKSTDDEICYILEWSDHIKKIFIFDLKDVVDLDVGQFSKNFEMNKDEILGIFQKLYFTKINEAK